MVMLVIFGVFMKIFVFLIWRCDGFERWIRIGVDVRVMFVVFLILWKVWSGCLVSGI